jgi:hypothetical protein
MNESTVYTYTLDELDWWGGDAKRWMQAAPVHAGVLYIDRHVRGERTDIRRVWVDGCLIYEAVPAR